MHPRKSTQQAQAHAHKREHGQAGWLSLCAASACERVRAGACACAHACVHFHVRVHACKAWTCMYLCSRTCRLVHVSSGLSVKALVHLCSSTLIATRRRRWPFCRRRAPAARPAMGPSSLWPGRIPATQSANDACTCAHGRLLLVWLGAEVHFWSIAVGAIAATATRPKCVAALGQPGAKATTVPPPAQLLSLLALRSAPGQTAVRFFCVPRQSHVNNIRGRSCRGFLQREWRRSCSRCKH